MAEWQDLEERFNRLVPEMKDSFIRVLSGEIPEVYQLGGPEIGHIETEFLTLAAVAGDLLVENGVLSNAEICSEKNPQTRWFKALYLEAKQVGSPAFGTQTIGGGEPKAYIMDRMREPAKASSSFCSVQGLIAPSVIEPEAPSILKAILWFSPKNIWRYKWQLILVVLFTLAVSNWGWIGEFLVGVFSGESSGDGR